MTDSGRSPSPLEIELRGEIDLSNASAIGDDLCDAIHRAAGTSIVVDVSAVSFIDSTAISMMLRVHHYAEAWQRSVTWRDVQPAPRQALELTGVDGVLKLE